jgi:hypothetical protein
MLGEQVGGGGFISDSPRGFGWSDRAVRTTHFLGPSTSSLITSFVLGTPAALGGIDVEFRILAVWSRGAG